MSLDQAFWGDKWELKDEPSAKVSVLQWPWNPEVMSLISTMHNQAQCLIFILHHSGLQLENFAISSMSQSYLALQRQLHTWLWQTQTIEWCQWNEIKILWNHVSLIQWVPQSWSWGHPALQVVHLYSEMNNLLQRSVVLLFFQHIIFVISQIHFVLYLHLAFRYR